MKLLISLLFILVVMIIVVFFLDIYMSNIDPKIVVFDMDETLGYFVELSIFCDIIEHYEKKKLTFKDFSEILDLYPEFLRPNILKVLSFLKIKKQNGECDGVIVYTNNQGPKSWAENIIRYLEDKLKYKLFDQIIGAFKVGAKRIEYNRTSHDKSVSDLVRCTGICNTSSICFLDDQLHDKMRKPNVYYINLKPYTFDLSYDEMAERYYKCNMGRISNENAFKNCVINNMKNSNYNKANFDFNYDINDITIGREILYHLQKFFSSFKRNKTRRSKVNKKKFKNITIKHNKK